MSQTPRCFELFGADFLVDAAGRVWLLEVNANPGWSHHGAEHRDLTRHVAEDLMELTVERWCPADAVRDASDSDDDSDADGSSSSTGAAAGVAASRRPRPVGTRQPGRPNGFRAFDLRLSSNSS